MFVRPKLHTLNTCSLLHVSYTSVKLLKEEEEIVLTKEDVRILPGPLSVAVMPRPRSQWHSPPAQGLFLLHQVDSRRKRLLTGRGE